MSKYNVSRRNFVKHAGIAAGAAAASIPAAAMADSPLSGSLLGSFLGGMSTEPTEEPAAEPVQQPAPVQTANQQNFSSIFAAYLDEQGVLYDVNPDTGSITIGYACENVDGLFALVRFDDDSPIATIVSWDLGNVGTDPANIASAILACNDMNGTYRWVKFYVDGDNDIAARIDSYIDESTCGEMCLAYVKRLIEVMDAAYPTLSPYAVA